MIKFNFPQKNRAEHGAVISEEKQTLLSKKREKLQSKIIQARFYIELTLNSSGESRNLPILPPDCHPMAIGFSEGWNLLTLIKFLFQTFPKHH